MAFHIALRRARSSVCLAAALSAGFVQPLVYGSSAYAQSPAAAQSIAQQISELDELLDYLKTMREIQDLINRINATLEGATTEQAVKDLQAGIAWARSHIRMTDALQRELTDAYGSEADGIGWMLRQLYGLTKTYGVAPAGLKAYGNKLVKYNAEAAKFRSALSGVNVAMQAFVAFAEDDDRSGPEALDRLANVIGSLEASLSLLSLSLNPVISAMLFVYTKALTNASDFAETVLEPRKKEIMGAIDFVDQVFEGRYEIPAGEPEQSEGELRVAALDALIAELANLRYQLTRENKTDYQAALAICAREQTNLMAGTPANAAIRKVDANQDGTIAPGEIETFVSGVDRMRGQADSLAVDADGGSPSRAFNTVYRIYTDQLPVALSLRGCVRGVLGDFAPDVLKPNADSFVPDWVKADDFFNVSILTEQTAARSAERVSAVPSTPLSVLGTGVVAPVFALPTEAVGEGYWTLSNVTYVSVDDGIGCTAPAESAVMQAQPAIEAPPGEEIVVEAEAEEPPVDLFVRFENRLAVTGLSGIGGGRDEFGDKKPVETMFAMALMFAIDEIGGEESNGRGMVAISPPADQDGHPDPLGEKGSILDLAGPHQLLVLAPRTAEEWAARREAERTFWRLVGTLLLAWIKLSPGFGVDPAGLSVGALEPLPQGGDADETPIADILVVGSRVQADALQTPPVLSSVSDISAGDECVIGLHAALGEGEPS
ncbi:MAG: hypothetical protein AAFR11_03735 [Pseudomonadota bacterium]